MLAQKSTSLQHGTCLTLWVQAASRFFRFTRICRETLTFLTQQTFPQPIEAPCGKGDQRALGHAENSALAGPTISTMPFLAVRFSNCRLLECTRAKQLLRKHSNCRKTSSTTLPKRRNCWCRARGFSGASLIMSSTGSTVKGSGWPRSASTFHQAQVICEPSIGAKFGQCVSAARRSTLAQPCSGSSRPASL